MDDLQRALKATCAAIEANNELLALATQNQQLLEEAKEAIQSAMGGGTARRGPDGEIIGADG